MPTQTIFALGESQILVSGGAQLSGITQGDGSHLDGRTITLLSNAWEPILIDDNDLEFDDNDGNQRLDGAQTFDDVPYADNVRVESEYTIVVEDPGGTQYTLYGLNFVEGGGPSFGTVEGLAFFDGPGSAIFPPIDVPLIVVSTSEGPNDVAYEDLATPPCFTPGTLIRTGKGDVDVADLSVGDVVLTLDHGPQPIRWIGRTTFGREALRQHPRFRPITLAAGAFGPGQPVADMQVSPQHRIFCAGWRAQLHFGLDEVLVAATKLQNETTIARDNSLTPVTYIHLLCAGHELIWSNDLVSESYYPSAADHSGMAQELAEVFSGEFGPLPAADMARPCISGSAAITLID